MATKTTAEMVAEAAVLGVEVTVTTAPKGTVEVTLLPGLRRPPEGDS